MVISPETPSDEASPLRAVCISLAAFLLRIAGLFQSESYREILLLESADNREQ